MKEFNKDKALTKLKLKKNKNTYIKYGSIILSCVILIIGIIYFTFAKFESNQSYTLINGKVGDYTSGDITLSYVVDGVSQSTPPGKNDGYVIKSVNCTNAIGTWDSTRWGLNVDDITGKAKCNLEFEEATYNIVQKWLATANINKSYTTLSEVFNDTETLNTLTNNNNSCDYLKNSTEWISDVTSNENAMTYIGNNDYCADTLLDDSNWFNDIVDSTYFEKVLNVKVPTMTGYTTPYGEVSASSYHSSYYPWKAFDSIDQYRDDWETSSTALNEWIQYKFINSVRIYKIVFRTRQNYETYITNCNWILQGSNDGSNYDDVLEFSTKANNSDFEIFNVENNANGYLYYRLISKSTTGNYNNVVLIQILQFYGREAN